jgi:electron transfer flavoprotein alpha subunit
MTETDSIWVFSEKDDLRRELIAGAQSLGQKAGWSVSVILSGPPEQAQAAIEAGAQTVFRIEAQTAPAILEDDVPTLAALIREHSPAAIFIGATVHGKAIAARLAACLNTSAITDVKQIEVHDRTLEIRHLIFGGGAERVERVIRRPAILTIGPGIYAAVESLATGPGEIRDVKCIPPENPVTVLERRPRTAANVNLVAARRVVCAGRGVARKEDLDVIRALARALSAELACTRPLAEGLDWLPRERYIGISGATVHPELYLGIGVSGQVQHLIGMTGSRVVVAVNKDPTAPIFQQADFCIASDWYEFVPKFIEALDR